MKSWLSPNCIETTLQSDSITPTTHLEIQCIKAFRSRWAANRLFQTLSLTKSRKKVKVVGLCPSDSTAVTEECEAYEESRLWPHPCRGNSKVKSLSIFRLYGSDLTQKNFK